MKKVDIRDAVGMVLAHDVTKIVPGKFKGPAFRKGHQITERDIDKLHDLGTEHIWVLDITEGQLHENEAGIRLGKALAGENVRWQGPVESKVEFFAEVDGITKIDKKAVNRVNQLNDVILATVHDETICCQGEILAGSRVIPLVIEESQVKEVEKIAQQPPRILQVKAFRNKQIGIVVTGAEIYKGRIEDKFGEVAKKKAEKYGFDIVGKIIVPDDLEKIKEAVAKLRDKNCEIILVTGGMSVDPDDVTLRSITELGAEIESYGAPVLPGTMFLLAYWNDLSILGVPACALFYQITVLDLVLPRILADLPVTKSDIQMLGYGGLCRKCGTCKFPVCSFGKK